MSIGPMATVAISAEEEQTAGYLAGVGPIMAEGSGARQALLDGLAQLKAGAGVDQVALAEKQGDTFRVLRARLGRLTLPRSCSRCHAAVARWLELHEAACMTLAAGGPKAMTKAGELVADARGVAQQFSAEYSRLVAETAARQQAAAAVTGRSAVVEDELDVEVADAADLDDPDELAVEKLAERLAEVAEVVEAPSRNRAPAGRAGLHATARQNGDAAWNALAAVSQARVLHPHGQLGAWLGAMEAVLAASAAVTAFIIAAEVAVLD